MSVCPEDSTLYQRNCKPWLVNDGSKENFCSELFLRVKKEGDRSDWNPLEGFLLVGVEETVGPV